MDETNNNKSKFSFGLNRRSSSNKKDIGHKKNSILDDQSDDDSSNNNFTAYNHEMQVHNTHGRNLVNQDLVAQQAAIRKRNEQLIQNDSKPHGGNNSAAVDIYDYDGQYDSFSSSMLMKQTQSNNKNNTNQAQRKESKYVSNLLKHANDRKQEREIIMERKIAKEQRAEEEQNEKEYAGKEQFVTKAYKRKLQERDAWLKEEKERARREEEEDVTKKSAAIEGFYGSMFGNIADTRGNIEPSDEIKSKDQTNYRNSSSNHDDDRNNRITFRNDDAFKSNHDDDYDYQLAVEDDTDQMMKKQAIRIKRIQKILDARKRYLKRKE